MRLCFHRLDNPLCPENSHQSFEVVRQHMQAHLGTDSRQRLREEIAPSVFSHSLDPERSSEVVPSGHSGPSGSRPTPPDVDVKALLGLQKSAIRTVLGPPDIRKANYPSLECHAAQCWSFTYGPGPSPLPAPTDDGDGTMSVYVTTGGPWLLILGFTKGRLVTAFWRGQK